MAKLSDFLVPPAKCGAYMGLPSRDRRKGGIWHCDHARKNIGKGKTRPPCLCAKALESALAALPQSSAPDRGEG